MTLATTISGANLTKIRSGLYQAQQFVAVVPNDIVVQFNPSVAPSASVYAEITVGTVASGSMSNIKSLQTVIYSTTTDFKATELYRTYVRKVSGTSTLYIGQTGQNLTTSLYVTVLNTYDTFERPRVIRNDVQYVDWDITFRRLLPVETALPSAVVLIDGETSWSPTAVPAEMDNDATSTFTHAWESSNGSDSLDSGGTTASPSWTLAADAHRWIRYTFTDSNGNSNIRLISVWTVPKDLSGQINLGFIGRDNSVANIQYQQGYGWSCDIPATHSISSLMRNTFCTIFSIEDYNATRGSIESNIDFVGWITDETIETSSSEDHGVISTARFVVHGFGTRFQLTGVPPLGITSDTTPTQWDDIENPTPIRVISYILTEHTNLLSLCAFKFPSNHTDYTAPSQFFTSELKIAYEAAQYQADALDGVMQFSHDGIFDITQNLVERDDTARSAADTVAAIVTSDIQSYRLTRNPLPLIRFLIVYAGSYNTSGAFYSVYRAYVPPVADIRGINDIEITNMVLTSDLSDANAQAEMAERSANKFASLNPADTLSVTFKDGWRFLQPDVGAWYTFTIDSTDTLRGIAYDSNTRWQLVEFSYTSNNQTGRKEVTGTFRRETQNTGANIEVVKLETTDDSNINAVPGILPPFTSNDLGLTDGNWFDSFDTSPPSDPNPQSGNCELLGFRPKQITDITTDQSALLGERISYLVEGSGAILEGDDTTQDLTSTNGGWVAKTVGDVDTPTRTITSGTAGTYSGGVGWEDGDYINNNGAYRRGVHIALDLGSVQTIDSFAYTFDYTKGNFSATSLVTSAISYSTDGVNFTFKAFSTAASMSTGNDQTMTEEFAVISARYIWFFFVCSHTSSPGTNTGSLTLKNVSMTSETVYGDALYYWTADTDPTPYDSSEGLLFEGAQPASIPSYNDTHQYTLYDGSVDSGPLLFSFESPYSRSFMTNWSLQITVCFLGVP
jgi:hypothetical protein